MKFLFNFLLLVSLSILQTCWMSMYIELDEYDDVFDMEPLFDHLPAEYVPAELDLLPPNITVYQQVEDRGYVIVVCKFTVWNGYFDWTSCELSVEGNYTMLMEWEHDEEFYFKVAVSPPASFTCVHEIGFNGNTKYLQSETYNYKDSVLDHHEEVSSFYIGFVSIISVCLIIMTIAVIAITIMSNTKEPIMTAPNNDYEDA